MPHTPGPWSVDSDPYEGIWIKSDTRIICQLTQYPKDKEELANANLIAAAPRMYEALKIASRLAMIASDWNLSEIELVDGEEMTPIHEIQSVFDAAIAAAEGKEGGIQ